MRASALGLAALAALSLSACGKETPVFTPTDLGQLDADWGSWLSLDVTPDGRVAASYYNKDAGALGFAVADGLGTDALSWRHERVDGYADDQGLDTGDRGTFSSMKVAPDGTVWVAYRDVGNKTLRVAHRTAPGVWESAVADAGTGLAPDGGHWASLALNASGEPVVAHHDAGSGVLRIARHSAGTWTAETAWTGAPWSGVDASGAAINRPASVGAFAKLLISGDTEYIAFYDAAQQSLELLEGTSGAWTHTRVHSGVNVGQWPSLLVEGETLYIAFQDVEAQDLLLATRTGGAPFSVRTLDAGELRGADTALFLAGGAPRVLYFDGLENDLLVASAAETPEIETLAGEADAVGFHNEVVAVGDKLWAGSYSYTQRKPLFFPL